MPSNFDILAANDFSRAFACFHESIVRRVRGDHTKPETVDAVVEIDSVTAQSVNSREGGLEQQQDRNRTVRGAQIEVAKDQETHGEDTWEFEGRLWKSVGEPVGTDAGTKTIAVHAVQRITGRRAEVNASPL